MIKNEIEFYSLLINRIDLDMRNKGLKNPDMLLSSEYQISRTQYYNIKSIAGGNQSTPRLSNSRLFKLCDYLGIEFEIMYKITNDVK